MLTTCNDGQPSSNGIPGVNGLPGSTGATGPDVMAQSSILFKLPHSVPSLLLFTRKSLV